MRAEIKEQRKRGSREAQGGDGARVGMGALVWEDPAQLQKPPQGDHQPRTFPGRVQMWNHAGDTEPQLKREDSLKAHVAPLQMDPRPEGLWLTALFRSNELLCIKGERQPDLPSCVSGPQGDVRPSL